MYLAKNSAWFGTPVQHLQMYISGCSIPLHVRLYILYLCTLGTCVANSTGPPKE
jgi:hypothetical protein